MTSNNSTPPWSTPLTAPQVLAISLSFRNVDVLTLSYRTQPEAVRRMIPEPLRPTSDWVLVHVYNSERPTSFKLRTRYGEV